VELDLSDELKNAARKGAAVRHGRAYPVLNIFG
jgi:hypothetical protein